MKKIIIGLTLFFVAQIAISQNGLPPRKWTVAQVKEMAKKYNMQDEVSEKNNVILLSLEKEQVESWLKRQYNVKVQRDKFDAYGKETKTVRTYQDYLNLLEKHPYVRAAIVKNRGGEEVFKKDTKEALKLNWRIYRNANGGLAFERDDRPISSQELSWGQRLDNLPKDR